MAINPITLLDGTTAYAHDVETKVNPLYTDIDNTNIAAGAGILFSKMEALPPAPVTGYGTLVVGNGAGVPSKVNLSGDVTMDDGGVVTVTNLGKVSITDDNASNASMFPVWVKANTGLLPTFVSSTQIYFNPLTSTLHCATFVGALTGNASSASQAANLQAGTYTYDGSGAVTVDARNALNSNACSGNAASATTAAACTGNSLTATTANALSAGALIHDNVVKMSGANIAMYEKYGYAPLTGNVGFQTIDSIDTAATFTRVSGKVTFYCVNQPGQVIGFLSAEVRFYYERGGSLLWGDVLDSKFGAIAPERYLSGAVIPKVDLSGNTVIFQLYPPANGDTNASWKIEWAGY